MDDIKELRDRYFNSLVLLNNKKDIMASLPQIEFQSFFPIIDGLIERLSEEIESAKQLLEETIDDVDKEELNSELELLNLKLATCKERKEEALRQTQIENFAMRDVMPKTIIFASTSSGSRIYFEQDLKSISEEYYGSILECFDYIENGSIESNDEKGHAMDSNNGKLSGIHEAKEFKVRVFYRFLAPDMAYVFMARMKKSNYDRDDREAPIKRNKNVNKEFEYLQKIISDPNKKQELIERHLEIKERIVEFINTQKRGNK